MSIPFRGYRFSSNYRSLEVWTFDATTHARISGGWKRPNCGMTRRERYDVLAARLRELGIPVPAYVPAVKEVAA